MIELDYTCRYCLTIDFPNNLISPCLCTGSVKYVHKNCLLTWLECKRNNMIFPLSSSFLKCEICNYEYDTICTYQTKKCNLVKSIFYEFAKYILVLSLFNIFISGVFTDINYGIVKGEGFLNRLVNISILYLILTDFLWCILLIFKEQRRNIHTWFNITFRTNSCEHPIMFSIYIFFGFFFWTFYDIAAKCIEKNTKQIIDITERNIV